VLSFTRSACFKCFCVNIVVCFCNGLSWLIYFILLDLVPVNFGFSSFVHRKSTLSQAFFNKRYFASLTCVFYFAVLFQLDWNPHRLHSEPLPPKEKHNVGPLRIDDDHDHICFSLRRFDYLAERSNVV
jgi:hypothetical protein